MFIVYHTTLNKVYFILSYHLIACPSDGLYRASVRIWEPVFSCAVYTGPFFHEEEFKPTSQYKLSKMQLHIHFKKSEFNTIRFRY